MAQPATVPQYNPQRSRDEREERDPKPHVPRTTLGRANCFPAQAGLSGSLTISSILSLIASSNCSGWLDAYTTMKRSVCSPVRYRKALSALRMSSLILCQKNGTRKRQETVRDASKHQHKTETDYGLTDQQLNLYHCPSPEVQYICIC